MSKLLFLVSNLPQLRLAIALALAIKQQGSGTLIFCFYPNKDFITENCFDYKLSDYQDVPGVLEQVDLAIFSVLETNPVCRYFALIHALAEDLGIPALTVQHGLFQPGLNFEYKSTLKTSKNPRRRRCAFSARSFTDYITFFGDEGIGYPLCEQDKIKSRGNLGRFVNKKMSLLIATNFNWDVYSYEDIFKFTRIINLLVFNYGNIEVSVCSHQAEKLFQKNDLELVSTFADLNYRRVENLFTVASDVDFVITTPSTVYMDAIALGIPAAMYMPDSFSEHVDFSFFDKKIVKFENQHDLNQIIQNYRAGRDVQSNDWALFKSETFIRQINKCLESSRHRSGTISSGAYTDYLQKLKTL